MKFELSNKIDSINQSITKTMKTNETFLKLVGERNSKGRKPIDYSQSITKRLLEKYKPTKKLSAIEGESEGIEKGLAA